MVDLGEFPELPGSKIFQIEATIRWTVKYSGKNERGKSDDTGGVGIGQHTMSILSQSLNSSDLGDQNGKSFKLSI